MSLLILLGLDPPDVLTMLPRGVLGSWVLLLLAMEFPRLRPGGDWTLHLLLTLSDLFIIALCTKPPIPFVGDGGRSSLSGEIRPCDGDIAKPRASDKESIFGGSNLCALVSGTGDPRPELLEPSWSPALLLDGEEEADRSGVSVMAFSFETLRDIPGICTLAEFDP